MLKDKEPHQTNVVHILLGVYVAIFASIAPFSPEVN